MTCTHSVASRVWDTLLFFSRAYIYQFLLFGRVCIYKKGRSEERKGKEDRKKKTPQRKVISNAPSVRGPTDRACVCLPFMLNTCGDFLEPSFSSSLSSSCRGKSFLTSVLNVSVKRAAEGCPINCQHALAYFLRRRPSPFHPPPLRPLALYSRTDFMLSEFS